LNLLPIKVNKTSKNSKRSSYCTS